MLAEMMRHGYTIKSLAAAADVHYLTIWRIVNQEHRPHKDTAEKICTILSCNPEQLGFELWGTGKDAESAE